MIKNTCIHLKQHLNDQSKVTFPILLQMSGKPNANKEFLEQLQMQELYGRKREDNSDSITYTDPADGTVYDWDPEKKAWFPKVWDTFPTQPFLTVIVFAL